jgi:hypothetical protein
MRYVEDFIGAVKARKVEVSESLAQGNASDYAAYQRLCGVIQGLQTSLDILDNLLKDEENE